MENAYKRIKLACYSVNISMAIVANLPPVLFLTFQTTYKLSYTLLGLLVLVNFLTQLSVDLIFSFFSHRFNISKTVKFTPVLTVCGLLVYAAAPFLFPGNVYPGLLIGTVIFSASGGLAEVLISPVIAAIPAKDPDREMSKLHSVYAWGVVAIITVSTLFLLAFGRENWQWLILLMSFLPMISICLFWGTSLPTMETPKRISGVLCFLKNNSLWLCICAIFLGGAAECTMAQWASGYLEQALQLDKVWGDIFGVALFALMLGLGRSMYAKAGKQIGKVLFAGAIGASVCYLLCAVTPFPILGLIACAFTGLCVSMLWPGNLIVATERFPNGGVFIFAMMAAGGDLGASVGPQLIGVITDMALKNDFLIACAENVGLLPEQFGMKLGMLIGMLFPMLAIPVYFYIWKKSKGQQTVVTR